MLKDDNLSLYAYSLILCATMLGASFLASDPRIEVAAIERDAVAMGEISTASIPQPEDPKDGWNSPTIPWTTYENGMAQMAATGKKGVLVLHTEWCVVCKSYRKMFTDPKVTRFADDYVFMLVDADKEGAVQQRFNVDGDYVPRTLLLSPTGELATDTTSGNPRQRFFVDPYDPLELGGLLERHAQR